MKVDIIQMKPSAPDSWAVFPRDVAPKKWDDDCEGNPLYGPSDDDDCIDWCRENGHSFRHRSQGTLIPPQFYVDLEEQCDRWFQKMASFAERCGRRLESDITYRASAAWKDQPTHYCYAGDMGGLARLVLVDDAKADADALVSAQSYLDMLFGASQALWELGITLTFNEDGKHKIFNSRIQWVTLDEE